MISSYLLTDNIVQLDPVMRSFHDHDMA